MEDNQPSVDALFLRMSRADNNNYPQACKEYAQAVAALDDEQRGIFAVEMIGDIIGHGYGLQTMSWTDEQVQNGDSRNNTRREAALEQIEMLAKKSVSAKTRKYAMMKLGVFASSDSLEFIRKGAISAIGRTAEESNCKEDIISAVRGLRQIATAGCEAEERSEAVQWIISLLADDKTAASAENELGELWGKNSPLLKEVIESAKNEIKRLECCDLHELRGLAVRYTGTGVVFSLTSRKAPVAPEKMQNSLLKNTHRA